MLIKSYIIENAKIEIHDDAYQNKTKEEIRQAIKEVERVGRNAQYKRILDRENKKF